MFLNLATIYMCILPTSRLIANLGQLVTWCLNLGYQVKKIGKPPYTRTHYLHSRYQTFVCLLRNLEIMFILTISQVESGSVWVKKLKEHWPNFNPVSVIIAQMKYKKKLNEKLWIYYASFVFLSSEIRNGVTSLIRKPIYCFYRVIDLVTKAVALRLDFHWSLTWQLI